MNWVPLWEHVTPLDAAERSGAHELVRWLRGHGAISFAELFAIDAWLRALRRDARRMLSDAAGRAHR